MRLATQRTWHDIHKPLVMSLARICDSEEWKSVNAVDGRMGRRMGAPGVVEATSMLTRPIEFPLAVFTGLSRRRQW